MKKLLTALPGSPAVAITLIVLAVALIIVVILFRRARASSVPSAPEKDLPEHLLPEDETGELAGNGGNVWLLWAKLLLTLIVIALVVALASAVYFGVQSNKPGFCGGCHATKKAYKSWRTSSHKQVACQTCHQESGDLGWLSARLRGLSHLSLETRYLSRQRPTTTSSVTTSGCMTCHEAAMSKTVVVGEIAVSHKEIISGGYRCGLCHRGVGHAKARALRARNVMYICQNCHDGRSASSTCSTCHKGPDNYPAPKSRSAYQVIPLQPPRCGNCHGAIDCTPCHTDD